MSKSFKTRRLPRTTIGYDLQPDPNTMLLPLAPDLWHAPHAFSANGIPVTTRMTVVRLPCGRLWLHSPVPVDEALRTSLAALGEVAWIVAPSKTHHLFVPACAQAFPAATLYGAPGLRAKRPDLGRLEELPAAGAAPWAPELAWLLFEGIPFANETVWFHRRSATLVLTDLVQWWPGALPWRSRGYAALTGVRRQPAVARTVRALVRDREAARASAERILRWPFERVVMAHNAIVETDAHARLRQAFAAFGVA